MNDNVARFVERHPITDQRLRVRLLEHQVRVLAGALRALARATDDATGTEVSKEISELLHECRLG